MKRVFLLFVAIVFCTFSYTHALCEVVGKLRIYGKGAAGDWNNPEFNAAYPFIKIEGSENLGVSNASDLITVLLTKEAYDIYAVNYANCNFAAVRDKGYALDISQDSEIASRVSRMHDFLSCVLSDGTSIYGIPIGITCEQWGISNSVWDLIYETAGFQIPQNYNEMFDFIEWWIENGQFEFPDVYLIKNAADVKKNIISIVTKQILDIAWSERSADVLLSQEVKNVFQRLESISFEDLNTYVADDDGSEARCVFDLACNWANLEEYGEEYAFDPLPLRLSDDVHLRIPVDMRVMFINPSTPLKSEAIAFLKYFMENQDSINDILMYNTVHAPVENPYIAKQIREAQHVLEEYMKKDRKAFAAEIDVMNKRMEYLDRMRWLVTESGIDEYQAIVTQLFVREYNPVYMNCEENSGGLDRYIEYFSIGRISYQQYCSEIYRLFCYALLEER